ncbi:transcription termination factor MTERF2, chloroplastic [Phragmites australis]|uniref:transcription termination factor MTERF2, chloroplastic n=1 Tax=Phragmites australis TaxID=29695 RepID=UPI002D79CEA9|nr:transcription termination factor MTERF2, chloroplastic [Phragmites australis]
MAAALPHSHLRLHFLPPLHTPDPSSSRRRRLRPPSPLTAVSRLQNPTTATHPVLPPPAPPPSAALLAAEGASLAPRREHRFPGSVASPRPADPAAGSLAEAEDAVLRRALEVRRAVAAEVLVAALSGGNVGGLTYIKKLTARMGRFVDRVVVEAAAMRRDRPELAHQSFNARARMYIQESGLVELVKWFKHNSMTYPQIAKVVCACSGDLEKVRRMIKWLRSIYVKGEFLGRVLANGESFLNRSFEELEEVVGYLESCGVRKDWIGYVVSRCPQLLNLSMDELETRVRFYTDMGMDEKDFGTMVYDYPRALGFLSLEEMNIKVQYLKEFGLSTEELGRLLAFKPQLMACGIEERWKPLVKYLYHLNISRDGMKRMLLVQPTIFCLDLETVIAPKVQFLQDIGVRSDAVGNVLVKFPPVLTYSLYKKIRPVVIFLLTKAGVKQEDIGKVIALDPQLLGCSISRKLEVSVKYFRSLGIYHFVLGQMVADFPTLLRYNVDILRPKYQYLRRVMVRPLKDLIEFPRFFSYSLEHRIEPRHQTLVANRINMKLRYMLTGPDEEFAQRVREAVERRARFEAGKAVLETSDAPETSKEAGVTEAAAAC